MGKIYDATLKHSQEPQAPPSPSAKRNGKSASQPDQTSPRSPGKLRSAAHRPAETAAEFDFLEYSLHTPRTPDFAQVRQRSNPFGTSPLPSNQQGRLTDTLPASAELPDELEPCVLEDALLGSTATGPARTAGLPVQTVEAERGRLDPHLVMLNETDPAAAEQYHRLAAALIAAAVERPLKRVLIASALHGDGRTCVTLNLAGALARARHRVLVVDADLLRPSVMRLLGVESAAPAGSALADGADEAQARATLVKLQPYDFTVLPSQGQVENAAELLASAEFGQLLDELDGAYDFVLFDSAPLLVAGDAHLLLHYADTVLLVVTPDKCRGGQVAQAIAPIPPEDLFGVVLNRTADGGLA